MYCLIITSITCFIISFKKIKIYKGVKIVTLPGVVGKMQVLLNHAESFILLKKGKIIIKNTKKKVINISKGLCYIKNNNIKIFL
ncbi:hypothetical protein J7J12_02135 [bacterium]|nr:hypothetical protein [bacterium]